MIRKNLFVVLCFLFPTFSSIAQVQEKHPDSYYANSHVTGIGTKTIVYHLDKALSPQLEQACQDYLSNYPRITQAVVSSNSITMEFNENIVSNEMIYLFIQRLEMNYIYKPKKS